MKSYIAHRQSSGGSDSISETPVYICIEHPVSNEYTQYIYILDTETRVRYYMTNFESAFDETMNNLYKNPRTLMNLAQEYPYICRAVLNGEKGGDDSAGILRKVPDYETMVEKWMLIFRIDNVRTKALSDYFEQDRLKEVLNYVIKFSDCVAWELEKICS